MLARVRPSGIFELFRLLRHGLVRWATYRTDVQPLEVTLRCKDERRKCFRFHRRFDPYDQAMFVVADELLEDRLEPLRAYG